MSELTFWQYSCLKDAVRSPVRASRYVGLKSCVNRGWLIRSTGNRPRRALYEITPTGRIVFEAAQASGEKYKV